MTRNVSVYIETYGCSANQSHSEIMMGLLEKNGFNITKNPENADLIILNTCIVKKPTENKMLRIIRDIRKEFPEKKMIIAGCMPVGETDILKKTEPNASFLGPNSSLKIVECVKKTIKDGRAVDFEENFMNSGDLPKRRLNPYINIVEISKGCMGSCAYCIVKKVKGSLISCSISDIERDIKISLRQRCKEVWLTSQDCGCYGVDAGTSLTELLKKVTEIDGDFRVRLGMSNPNHIKPVLSDLVDVYRDKKIYKFLHIPVQSGSNRILRDMKRQYVTRDFRNIISGFRADIPNVTIWTDIIVGFPGETEADFKETIQLLKETKPDFVNVSKFGIRPGTPAEKMEQVPGKVVSKRSKELTLLVDKLSLESNRKWIGKECHVLVTERGRKSGQYIGRNESYKPVLIEETDKDIMGKFVTLIVSDAKKTHLVGILRDF